MYIQGHLAALKHYIASHGDTQVSLAKALGLDKTLLGCKLNETDGKELTAPEMQAICEYYNIPLDQRTALFFGAR